MEIVGTTLRAHLFGFIGLTALLGKSVGIGNFQNKCSRRDMQDR